MKNRKWIRKDPMPWKVADASLAKINDKFYIIGGYQREGFLDRLKTKFRPLDTASISTVYEFDPQNENYERKSDMPTERWGHIAVGMEEEIYVFGGSVFGLGDTYLSKVEKYNVESNTWKELSKMPISAGGQVGIEHSGKIYLFGGKTEEGPTGKVFEFDPKNNKYSLKSNMPTPRGWSVLGKIEDKVFVIGGSDSEGSVCVNEMYDISKDNWESREDCPLPIHGAGRENPVVGSKIYVTHGLDLTPKNKINFLTSAFEYDPSKDAWGEIGRANVSRDGTCCGIHQNKLWVFGGRNKAPGEGLSDLEVLSP